MAVEAGKVRSHVRVDGRAKVTGKATFAADFLISNLAHATVVTSTVARGRITGFDLAQSRRIAGVLRIFTYADFADAIRPVKHLMAGGYVNSSAQPLGSAEVHYAGQIVAMVVAESREVAEHAAALVRVRYAEAPSSAVIGQAGADSVALAVLRPDHTDATRGDAHQEFGSAAVQVDSTFRTPIQHHNPMELFGTTCVWNGDRLTVYEASRYIKAAQHGLAAQLGIDAEKIRVVCPFMGGHFGSRLALSQYTAPVAIAARLLQRPVRYVATRAQGFTIANHRPDTQHRVRIAATTEGTFTALLHDAKATTSRFDDFAMQGTDVTASIYKWGSVATTESLVRVDRNTPGPMRAPPEVPYLFALESAVDELAEKLSMDPIELRRRNDTQVDLMSGKPFTPRALMDCFDAGAKAFGWAERKPKPASMRDGDWLAGYGCASAVRPVKRGAATMRVALDAEGRVIVETAHHEIGNGIYTVLAMEAAGRLGTEIEAVTVRLGDTALPPAGISGGSSTTTSLVPALAIACEDLRGRLAQAAIAHATAFAHFAVQDLRLKERYLVGPGGASLRLSDLFAWLGTTKIETLARAAPERNGEEAFAKLREGKMGLGGTQNTVRWAYGAHFAEVRVHARTGDIRVPRLTGAFSAGYIINRLTALSQLRGAMIWGIGSALLEATVPDARTSRYVNDNLSEYLVATAADTDEVNAILLNADADPAELMGLGELGIIGVNAAIANALHHATGRRLRSLPIRLDQLL